MSAACNDTDASFSDKEKTIKTRYAHLADFESEENALFALDFIEAQEDLDEVQPVFDAIVTGRLGDKEFRMARAELDVRLWQLVEHLRRLSDTISREVERTFKSDEDLAELFQGHLGLAERQLSKMKEHQGPDCEDGEGSAGAAPAESKT